MCQEKLYSNTSANTLIGKRREAEKTKLKQLQKPSFGIVIILMTITV